MPGRPNFAYQERPAGGAQLWRLNRLGRLRVVDEKESGQEIASVATIAAPTSAAPTSRAKWWTLVRASPAPSPCGNEQPASSSGPRLRRSCRRARVRADGEVDDGDDSGGRPGQERWKHEPAVVSREHCDEERRGKSELDAQRTEPAALLDLGCG